MSNVDAAKLAESWIALAKLVGATGSDTIAACVAVICALYDSAAKSEDEYASLVALTARALTEYPREPKGAGN